MNKSKIYRLIGLLLILGLFIAACSSNNVEINQVKEECRCCSEDGNYRCNDVETINDAENSDESEEEDTEVSEDVQVLGYSEARDFIAAYFLGQYGIEQIEPWMEQNLTTEGLVGSSTIRFVSGSLTINISAPVVALENLIYTIEEASDIANGFYWEGTLSYYGEIAESIVRLPGTILDDELARDAVLAYLSDAEFGKWVDDGYSQSGDGTNIKTFTYDSWTVSVEFAPSAPLVASYHVTVENSADGFAWEGDISLRGEISE